MPGFLTIDKFTHAIKQSYESFKLPLKRKSPFLASYSSRDVAENVQSNALAEFLQEASTAYEKSMALEEGLAHSEKFQQSKTVVALKEDKAEPLAAEAFKASICVLEPVSKEAIQRKCLCASQKEKALAYNRENNRKSKGFFKKTSPC